ncbi:hypothetical protein [Flavobacterium sp. C4GT6]|uniref:hypothetical protein n=1 Tax=Flavobacterium sp. C4GT6 TaxID=3103818 RepID=UPI002ED41E54
METELKEILELIAALKDNGSNTAAQVREVLTKMTNYKAGGTNGFEVATENVVTNDIQSYHYSFKGVENQCCNAYLMLKNNSGSETAAGGRFQLEISEEQYNLLRAFIPDGDEDNISLFYTVPQFSDISKTTYRTITLNVIKEGTFFLLVIRTNLAPGEMISTSIAVNFKKLTVDNITGIKKDKMYIKAMDTIKNNLTR